LTTNGVLLTQKYSEELIKRGLDIITVSIAGATQRTHGHIRRGSHLEQIVKNIHTLSTLKAHMGSRTPKILLSFLMTKSNVNELPEAVRLSKDLGIDEMVATNLDYTPTQAQDDLKVFSCQAADIELKKLIEVAEKTAETIKISLHTYSLEMEDLVLCEMNPLRIVFFSHDGGVSPCVYLNIPKHGEIPRIFCGKHCLVKQVCFGNVQKQDLLEIWSSSAYKSFRSIYQNRLNIMQKFYGEAVFGMGRAYELDAAENALKKEMKQYPLPQACRLCYKAYNI
jgi:MoaA/NifB/PqqE/SkfB family radical SAM enzyme